MHKSLLSLSFLGLATAANATDNNCSSTPPTKCYPSDCRPCHCLGPENYGVNAPVGPKTCDGDFSIGIAGFYWNAHQDGMAYALRNNVISPDAAAVLTEDDIQTQNNLVDAKYQTPDFGWDFGFKFGVGYTACRDGWDIGLVWTWYQGKANDTVEAAVNSNQTLLPIWSAFTPDLGSVLYASEVESQWKLKLNLADIELGRQFWVSKYLSLRPHAGLRIAYLEQDFELKHKGGSWLQAAPGYIGVAEFENDYKGVGLRCGFNSEWNLGCGWAFYADFAAAIVYGRFSVESNEYTREVSNTHGKRAILETENSFRASRGMLDSALGLQWSTMFCDCKYGLTARLGWEHHLFLDQNQLSRAVRTGAGIALPSFPPNNTGENTFTQRRGDLDTQGWTLSFKFDF